MSYARVKEHTILIDAVKDLLNHVCTAAEKTTINDFIENFTSNIHESDKKTAAICSAVVSDVTSAPDDKMVLNSPEKSLTIDTCSADENNKDAMAETICRAEEIDDMKDAEVAAADTSDVVKEDCEWKLFIKVYRRNKNMPHNR